VTVLLAWQLGAGIEKNKQALWARTATAGACTGTARNSFAAWASPAAFLNLAEPSQAPDHAGPQSGAGLEGRRCWLVSRHGRRA
jgi:hypothetical protein